VRRAAASLLLLLPAAALAQDPFAGDPFESRFKNQPRFEVRIRVPEGGGEVHLKTTGPVHYEKDVFWEGTGGVTIEYEDVKITSDHARYDFATGEAILTGNVVIDQGKTRMSGSRAGFRIKEKTGWMENAKADLEPSYHITADRIDKTADTTYRITRGVFSSCDIPDPEWSFRMSEATVTLEDYARLKEVTFRAGSVPLLYTPYLIWPTKSDRASGMLVPGVGISSRRGGYLGLNHFWAISRSTDLTTQVDLFTGGTLGLGETFRWAPTRESAGIFQGYVVDDEEASQCVTPAEAEGEETFGPCIRFDGSVGVLVYASATRWKLRLDHVSDDLPWGFRGVVSVRRYSDEYFAQDLERNFDLASAKQYPSEAFLTKNWGANSLNVHLSRIETYYGVKVVQERLPTIEYARRTSPLGSTPFYFAMRSSASYLSQDRGPTLPEGSYGRFDLFPVVTLPFRPAPWLSFSARAGARYTGYSDSYLVPEGPIANPTSFSGETFQRFYGDAGMTMVGPSFSKLFDGKIGRFVKFKHILEPRVDYTYVSEVDDPLKIPVFDEIDSALGRNEVTYALVNRLLARGADPKSGGAVEIAQLTISQTYAFELPQRLVPSSSPFDPANRKTGPVNLTVRIAPGSVVALDARLAFDTAASDLSATSLSAGWNKGDDYVNATWYRSQAQVAPGVLVPASDQYRLAAGFDLGKLLRIDTILNYDALQDLLIEDRTLGTFRFSCFEILAEYRQLRTPPSPRRDYRIAVNLKDVGQLFDLNGSLDSLLGGP
jgi:LPS-assembly protein